MLDDKIARDFLACLDALAKSPVNTDTIASPRLIIAINRSVTVPVSIPKVLRPISMMPLNVSDKPTKIAPKAFTAPAALPDPLNPSSSVCVARPLTKLNLAISRCRSAAAIAALGPVLMPKRSASSTNSCSSVPLRACSSMVPDSPNSCVASAALVVESSTPAILDNDSLRTSSALRISPSAFSTLIPKASKATLASPVSRAISDIRLGS